MSGVWIGLFCVQNHRNIYSIREWNRLRSLNPASFASLRSWIEPSTVHLNRRSMQGNWRKRRGGAPWRPGARQQMSHLPLGVPPLHHTRKKLTYTLIMLRLCYLCAFSTCYCVLLGCLALHPTVCNVYVWTGVRVGGALLIFIWRHRIGDPKCCRDDSRDDRLL